MDGTSNKMQYWRLYLMAVVLGIGGSFQYGIQVSVVAAPAVHVQTFVNYTWMWRYQRPVDESTKQLIWSFIVAVMSLGAWVGAINAGSLPVKYGREIMGIDEMWPFLLAISSVPAILPFLALCFFPESPRHLYIDKGDREGAKKALQWLWQEDNLKMELEDMQKERESTQGEKAKTVKDILTCRRVRWQLLTLVLTCSANQFCGYNALYFYAFDIFSESGAPEELREYLTIGIGAMEFIAVMLCSFLIDRAGRKKLMGYGYLMMAVAMSLLTIMLCIKDLNSWIPYVNIGLIFCVICIYGLGPSGVAFALPADLFLQAWRPAAFVVSGTIGWLSMFLVGMCFSYVVNGLGQYCFLIFVIYCLISGSFMIFLVPETKGKSMLEIMEDFNKLNYKNRETELATKF
ncbi:solute carrier family 2, facilitated glucose transporter member 9-like isoform X3 [Hippocampus zosterae]|uniref:solute carrier family 2, facilitated glucose transporter member 9-like isoform X3 n=1 Tax=Hippocampus zosterae TaxID=109293 RepID=UPI00223CC479|nr:solute carrier family 2, facilitated glucose transporter member 9-like isoform X3 [Hippocampus zosterae]